MMDSALHCKGVYPAVTTQLATDLSLDLDPRRHVQRALADDGVDGLVGLGALPRKQLVGAGREAGCAGRREGSRRRPRASPPPHRRACPLSDRGCREGAGDPNVRSAGNLRLIRRRIFFRIDGRTAGNPMRLVGGRAHLLRVGSTGARLEEVLVPFIPKLTDRRGEACCSRTPESYDGCWRFVAQGDTPLAAPARGRDPG